MLKRFLLWWRSLRYRRPYVIMDGRDNSVTFSHRLYRHIELSTHCKDAAKVFVFQIPDWHTYGFSVNPVLEKETQLADIQYNGKYKTIGFESLCPTVGRILYDYGMPDGLKVKLTVTIHRLGDGGLFYNIERPRQ